MECTKVSIGNAFSTHKTTLEQFRKNAEGFKLGSWGKLVLALAEEDTWSKEYSFSAHLLEDGSYLLVNCPDSLLRVNNPRTFRQEHDISVCGVRDAICAYLRQLHEEVQTEIAQLRNDADDLAEAALQIVSKETQTVVLVDGHKSRPLRHTNQISEI